LLDRLHLQHKHDAITAKAPTTHVMAEIMGMFVPELLPDTVTSAIFEELVISENLLTIDGVVIEEA
jgi:hypothetical protein